VAVFFEGGEIGCPQLFGGLPGTRGGVELVL